MNNALYLAKINAIMAKCANDCLKEQGDAMALITKAMAGSGSREALVQEIERIQTNLRMMIEDKIAIREKEIAVFEASIPSEE